MKDNGSKVSVGDFQIKPGKAPVANRVELPPNLRPPPVVEPDMNIEGKSQSMVDKFNAYN